MACKSNKLWASSCVSVLLFCFKLKRKLISFQDRKELNGNPPLRTDQMPSASKTNTRKRKLPRSFLECPSLSLVANFPQKRQGDSSLQPVVTSAASEATKEIFLDRFAKEIVKPFRSTTVAGGGETSYVMVDGKLQKQAPAKYQKIVESKTRTWSQRVRMGTNQCLRILEKCMASDDASTTSISKPLLIVLARDIYPPTMLVHVPVIASRLDIPLLLLPGKASNEIGQTIGVKKASILLFLSPNKEDDDTANAKFNSFLDFVRSDMIKKID